MVVVHCTQPVAHRRGHTRRVVAPGGRQPLVRGNDKFGTGFVAAALSLPLGLGLGHAVIGSPKRGAVWLVLLFGALAAMLKSIWFLPIAGVIFVAGVLDAFVLGFRKREQLPFRWVSPWVFVLPAISVASALAIRKFVVESFRARSTSMAPTLQNGDMIFIDKVTAPARGDVIVFAYPCDPQRDYVFRMIADAGDSVEVRCGIVSRPAWPRADDRLRARPRRPGPGGQPRP